MRLLVTGGAGFIGSHFIRYMLDKYPDYSIINLDKLTYASCVENLSGPDDGRYRFVRGDVRDREAVSALAKEVDVMVNFAAETHVDRSILEPGDFIQTDIYGTYVLLDAAIRSRHQRYLQISTDEVYGSFLHRAFKEDDPLFPSSPYSASKAAADLLALSYHKTFGLSVLITRSSNNFGPFQFPEKLIPLFITNAIEDRPLPLYGDGGNIRNWLYVLDNCEAIDLVLHKGSPGEIYNVGGETEVTNLEITTTILRELGKPKELIRFVKDRLGHDRRYSLDCAKIRRLGFKPAHRFSNAMRATVDWYVHNREWWQRRKSADYWTYYERVYGDALKGKLS